MARYARACIFGDEDKIEIHLNQKKQAGLDRLKVQGALGKIGSNFNQLAKQLNSKYDFITAKTLIAEMEKIRIELEKISNLNDGE
ncbi:bacterial mobilization family protein [Burkholderia cepacia]|nr:bacterial mobilization family protein [Burkholderia cepacia]